MTLWRLIVKLGRMALVAATALAGPAASALTPIPPPAAISLQFEASTDRLTHAGLVGVDELAVRAAQCPAQALAVHVVPAARVAPALTRRRVAVVRERLDRLGLKLAVEMKPLREKGTAPPRHRGMLLADVGGDDDVWCNLREGSQVFPWADELGRHVEGAEPRLPAFWQRLSAQGRLSLALPLANAALCAESSGCTRHPELYHWLAEKVWATASPRSRRWWLLNLWVQAEAAEVERFRRRWALAPLTLAERGSQVSKLVSGRLPWALIEQRLLEPGLMARVGDEPMLLHGLGAYGLLSVASRRGELDSLDRLISAAGPAKACFTVMALQSAGEDQESFDAWKPHVARWVQGALTPHKTRGWPVSCSPVALVVNEAFCVEEPDDVSARFEALWDVLQQAGVTFDTPEVRQFIRPGLGHEFCKLEPVPGSTTRLRRVAPP